MKKTHGKKVVALLLTLVLLLQMVPVAAMAGTGAMEQVRTPLSHLPSGAYFRGFQTILISPTSGARIYFTVDGSDPASSPTRTLYTHPIVIDRDFTLGIIAEKDGMIPSEVAWFHYTIRGAGQPGQPGQPPYSLLEIRRLAIGGHEGVITQGANFDGTITFRVPQSALTNGRLEGAVTALEADAEVIIILSCGTQTGVGIGDHASLAAGDQVFVAIIGGRLYSIVIEVTNVEGQVATPFSHLPSGAYFRGFQIILISPTPGSRIYFTTDGSCPLTSPTRTLYTRPIRIEQDFTLGLVAEKDGMQPSNTAWFHFTVR